MMMMMMMMVVVVVVMMMMMIMMMMMMMTVVVINVFRRMLRTACEHSAWLLKIFQKLITPIGRNGIMLPGRDLFPVMLLFATLTPLSGGVPKGSLKPWDSI